MISGCTSGVARKTWWSGIVKINILVFRLLQHALSPFISNAEHIVGLSCSHVSSPTWKEFLSFLSLNIILQIVYKGPSLGTDATTTKMRFALHLVQANSKPASRDVYSSYSPITPVWPHHIFPIVDWAW